MLKRQRKSKPAYFLVDAQEMHRLHPDTFDVPTTQKLSNIEIGDYITVCIDNRMRSCLEVIDFDRKKPIMDRTFYALVYDNPFMTNLRLWDHVEFQAKHVYDISKKAEIMAIRQGRGSK